jgi:acid phosphatase
VVTPNVVDDMHDGTIPQGDSWLANNLPLVLNGPDYQSGRLLVVIVWDEGSGSGDAPSHVPLVELSESTPKGTTVSASMNDYSLTGLIDSVAGLPPLRG